MFVACGNPHPPSVLPQVNLFFLLNIVRVLITKLKVTHQAESHLYMKAVRATLILVPLLGIQFVLLPWRPEGRPVEEVYDYIMNILMHYQVGGQLGQRGPGGQWGGQCRGGGRGGAATWAAGGFPGGHTLAGGTWRVWYGLYTQVSLDAEAVSGF